MQTEAEAAEIHHHANAGGNEQQRQVLREPIGRRADGIRNAIARAQCKEQQAHADDGSGNRNSEQAGRGFARALEQEQPRYAHKKRTHCS